MISTAGLELVRLGDDANETLKRVGRIYRNATLSGDWSALRTIRVELSNVQLRDMRVAVEQALPQPRVVDDETKSYLDYLARKILIGVIVLLGSTIVAWVAALNLVLFLTDGVSPFHPAISVCMLVASIGLVIVALASLYTGWRHVRETVRKL